MGYDYDLIPAKQNVTGGLEDYQTQDISITNQRPILTTLFIFVASEKQTIVLMFLLNMRH